MTVTRTEWRLDMGAAPTREGVRFRVWAPAARLVEVELAHDRRVIPLQRGDDGVWFATVLEARPGTRYWYRLNGQLKRPDPYSRYQPEGVHGPSQVVDPGGYVWHDSDWRGLSIKGLVIYELHVGTATPEGTFDAMVQLLPRLKSLGVNAIEPLPVAEFPGSRNWGYDGVDPFAVSRAYGGPEAFKRFVDAAHAYGLGVLVDVVYNHFGPDGNYLRDFSPDYFTDRHQTPWGAALNYDGPNSKWVRKLVLDNARFWLHEYHADGLRLDATHAIFDGSRMHLLAELSETVHASLPEERQVVLIAETHENDVRYLRRVDEGGLGLDAVLADDFHHSLRRYLAGDHQGYFSRFTGTLDEVARCIQEGWLRRGTPAGDRPAWQFVYALQNHDQVGNRAFGERLHHQIDLDRFAAASVLLLFLPYTPMLFMGQEFAASTPFQFFTDHKPDLGKLVTEGRRREFKAFSEFRDAATRERIPDPQAESTFLRSKLVLSEAESPPGSECRSLYGALLAVRGNDAVLKEQARDSMHACALTEEVLAVRRWRASDERLLLVNFGESAARVAQYGGGWRIVLESRPGTTADSASVGVPGRSAVILARESR